MEDLSNNASPYVVHNVVLTVHSASPIMTYANFMDGLFFFSRPKNLFIRSTDEQKRYVEVCVLCYLPNGDACVTFSFDGYILVSSDVLICLNGSIFVGFRKELYHAATIGK